MATVEEHFERIIIEVLGAEEGGRKIKALREEEEKHAKTLKGMKKQAEEAAKAETKAADDFERAQKKRQEATKQTMKVAAGGVAMLAAAAADASAKLEQAQGKIDRAFKKAGVSIADQSKAMDAADANARRLGLSLIETRENMARLLGATGDVAIATQDLALANDIAATGHMGAAQAVELLTKARKGELEELKQLEGLNKQSIEALGAISDQSERAAAAVKMLSQEYSGAADELKGTTDAMANLKEAGVDLLAALGDAGSGLISATAEWLGLVDEGEDGVDALAQKIRQFSRDALEAATHVEAWKRWREQGGLTGDRDFFSFVSEIDSEKAIAAAEGAGQTPRTRENVGRGGRRGYGGNKGGHRDVPRETAAPKGRGRAAVPEEDPTAGGFLGEFGGHTYGDSQSVTEFQEAQKAHEEFEKAKTSITMEEAIKRGEIERDAAKKSAAALKEVLADAPDVIADVRDQQKEAQKESIEVTDAAIGAADKLAGSFIKDEGTKAVISGGIEVARAISAAASYNIPAAIGHGASAAQYFAVAAKAGIGGGGVKSKGGGGAKGARPQLSQDRERVDLSNERSRSREARASQTQVVNVYSTFGPSPSQSRELVDAVEREMRNRTGGR